VSLSSATISVVVLGDRGSLFWEEVMPYKQMLATIIFYLLFFFGPHHFAKCFTQFFTQVSWLQAFLECTILPFTTQIPFRAWQRTLVT